MNSEAKEEQLIGTWKKVFGRKKINTVWEDDTLVINQCILIKPDVLVGVSLAPQWFVYFRNKRLELFKYATCYTWRNTIGSVMALNAELLTFLYLKKEPDSKSAFNDYDLTPFNPVPVTCPPTTKFAFHFFPRCPITPDLIELVSEYGLEVYESNSFTLGVMIEAENNTLATEFVLTTFKQVNIAGSLTPAPEAR